MQLSEPSVQERRKRARWRAWHRGMKEIDIVLGRFADEYLDGMSKEELAEFEDVLTIEDVELFSWLVRREPVPAERDSEMLRRLLAHSVDG